MQMCKRISVLVSFILLFFSAQSQSWQPLGPDDFYEPTFNPASISSMVCDAANQIYIAFFDGYTSTGQVRKFNGTTWEQVGNPNIYLGSALVDYNILMDAANIPTLVYQDVSNNRKAAIKKFIGGNWVSYGTGIISQGPAYNLVAATDASGKLYCAYADGSLGFNLTLSVGADAWPFTPIATISGAASAVSMAIDGYVMTNEGSGWAYIAYADGPNGSTLSVKKYNSGSLEYVGAPTLSTGSVNYTSIALGADKNPYVAFTDGANGNKVSVKKFDGASWVDVGTPYFSNGAARYVKLKVDGSGIPYVTYTDAGSSNKTIVKKFDGSTWVDAGTGVSSAMNTGSNTYQNLVIDATGTPFVGYTESLYNGKAVVKRLNGGTWTAVGGMGVTSGAVRSFKMVVNSLGVPYAVYADWFSNYNAAVIKYDGSNWVPVSANGLSGNPAGNTSIAMGPNDVPYIVYTGIGGITVKKLDGGTWVDVGTPGFVSVSIDYSSIVVDAGGTPYVAYKNMVTSKINVQKFDGSNWMYVGQADFSAGAANYISIALDASGIPYVTYSDAGNGSLATVKKLDGGNWVDVGSPGISTGSTYLNCLAIAGNGTLYAAYYDTEVKVKMFDGTTWVDVGSSPTANAGKLAFAIDGNNVPYVAYVPTSQLEIAVKKFDGSNWSAVGTPAMAGRPGHPLVLVFGVGNNPIISYWNGGSFVKSFSPLVILPLRLTEFNGRINNADAFLNWKTDNEVNTREFIIERSIDGRNYAAAGTVPTNNESGAHQYAFTDRSIDQLGASFVYYRLKQVDIDGKSSYSRVLILPVEQSGSRVVCYPNPVTSETNVTITLDRAEKVQARLINNIGQVMQAQQWSLSAGSSSFPINMSRLPQGLYYLEISCQSIKKQIGLVKQ
jgi:hypothetical protein